MRLSRTLLALALALPGCQNPPQALPPELAGAPLFDCNGNGVEDAIDVCVGTCADLDQDGIPDECQAR